MNRPGRVSNSRTPISAAVAAMKSARADPAVDPAEVPGPYPVEPGQCGDVHQLDDRGDDDGGERGFGQVLEQAGEEQQGDDGERGDEEAGGLCLGAGVDVDRGLGQGAIHDHPGGEPGADVGGADPDEFPVRVDVATLLSGVRLGWAEALDEAEKKDAGSE